MKKLVLIDGHNLMFQMYYGMPNKILNSKNIDIRGAIGFIGGLNKIINMLNPDNILVSFDGEEPPNKTTLDQNYKANRPALDVNDNPFVGYQYIKTCLDNMHIKHFENTLIETDDLIAKYVNTYKDTYKIYVVSSDKDFYSLVSDNVEVFTYRGKNSKFITPQYILEKYNIKPHNFGLFKCLVGDTSDNIAGIKGIGPKTASNLINKYSTLDNMLCLDIIKNNYQLLLHNRQLIDFDCNIRLPFDIADLGFINTNLTTTQILKISNVY